MFSNIQREKEAKMQGKNISQSTIPKNGGGASANTSVTGK
jgi:hypothetical protein